MKRTFNVLLWTIATPLAAATYTVVNTNDSGPGSLRQTILYANFDPQPDLIAFNIPGAGVHTISPLSELPHITRWVTIDGYTQPGASPNTQLTSDDAVLLIELNGELAGNSSGLVSEGAANEVIIRGLVINRFQISNVHIDNGGYLEGCFIGTDPTGTIARAQGYGRGVYSQLATIGGTLPAQRNVISGNGGPGIEARWYSLIQGNFIGIDATGTAALPNAINVDLVWGDAVIGGPVASAGVPPGNVISGSTSYGVRLAPSEFHTATVQGNLIGTDATGTTAIPNGSHGVLIWQDPGYPGPGWSIVGGVDPEDGNVIAYNLGGGIEVAEEASETPYNAVLRSNRIHSNAGLGVDRREDGVTPNSDGSSSNYPVLTAAASSGGLTSIQGTLNREPNVAVIAIDLFSSTACDTSGNGEGTTLIGSTTVNTDAAGSAGLSVMLPLSLEPGSVVTATASKGWFTSEFSACRIVTDVLPTLQVLGVAPASGDAAGGVPVTVSGTSFPPGASVTIGGVLAADVVVVDSSTITAKTPTLPPGKLLEVAVADPPASASATLPAAWMADFLDVPQADIFHASVEAIFRTGITAGCGGGDYCRNSPILGKQLAVFLVKARYGPTYVPPACHPDFWFYDVPCPGPFADWMQWFCVEVFPCFSSAFGPDEPVRRDEMAVYLLTARHGLDYYPPACTPPGLYADVPCPGLYTDFIEQLAAEGITGGCGGGNYCPENLVTRGQTAVFLVKSFQLP